MRCRLDRGESFIGSAVRVLVQMAAAAAAPIIELYPRINHPISYKRRLLLQQFNTTAQFITTNVSVYACRRAWSVPPADDTSFLCLPPPASPSGGDLIRGSASVGRREGGGGRGVNPYNRTSVDTAPYIYIQVPNRFHVMEDC